MSLAKVETLQTQVCDDPTMSGAVITHGTGTLEESAFFLDATENCGKPRYLFGGRIAQTRKKKSELVMHLLHFHFITRE